MKLLLCGKAGAGKTTAAGFLKEIGYKEFTVGGVIKEIAHILYHGPRHENLYKIIASELELPISEKFLFEMDELTKNLKEIDISKKAELRPYLQKLGDIVRAIDEDAFLKFIIKEVERTKGPIVISDGRLEREIEFLSKYNFKPYEIVTDDKTRLERLKKRDPGFDPASLNHRTEEARFNCPKICNNGTLEELREKILGIGGAKSETCVS